jgi:hypothetical protein
MQLRALAASLAGAALLFGAHAAAADPPNFDFNGYAQVATAVGQPLVMYSVLTNNGVVPTPILLDFVNYEYTLVIQGTLASAAGIAQHYGAAQIALYSDARSGGTAASYANLPTFTDGTLILSGNFVDLIRNTYLPSLGNFTGQVNFTAGTRLGDLATPNGWPCGGGWSRTISGIPAGFQENWDGKIDIAPVAVEPQSWGAVKHLFQ